MKRALFVVLIMLFVFSAFGKEIVFWTAPNPLQESFWKELVKQWNEENPDIQINWSTIPAAGSSEEAILTSIASGRSPDICTNIFSGFAAQLIEADQLVPLETLPGYWELIEQREMKQIVEGWKFNGHYFVFPIYSNPMLMWWRGDLLQELGYDSPPRTYSEIYEISEKYSVPNEKFGMQVILGRNWWDRWFDFINYYYAASGGNSYLDLERARATFNNEHGKSITEFFYKMFRNNWTAVDLGNYPLYNGVVLGGIRGPWEINWAKEQFPDVFDDIVISPPPVPDYYPDEDPVYTFADTKGLVILKSCKYKEEAWEFLKWVYSNEENDLRWVTMTNLPPARGDLSTNEMFTDYMAENDFFAQYASFVPYAVPPALTTKTVDIQDAMTDHLIEPLMYDRAGPEEALNDIVRRIRTILF